MSKDRDPDLAPIAGKVFTVVVIVVLAFMLAALWTRAGRGQDWPADADCNDAWLTPDMWIPGQTCKCCLVNACLIYGGAEPYKIEACANNVSGTPPLPTCDEMMEGMLAELAKAPTPVPPLWGADLFTPTITPSEPGAMWTPTLPPPPSTPTISEPTVTPPPAALP